jgi:hypothetical protein
MIDGYKTVGRHGRICVVSATSRRAGLGKRKSKLDCPLWVSKGPSATIKTLPGNDRFCVGNGHHPDMHRQPFRKTADVSNGRTSDNTCQVKSGLLHRKSMNMHQALKTNSPRKAGYSSNLFGNVPLD